MTWRLLWPFLLCAGALLAAGQQIPKVPVDINIVSAKAEPGLLSASKMPIAAAKDSAQAAVGMTVPRNAQRKQKHIFVPTDPNDEPTLRQFSWTVFREVTLPYNETEVKTHTGAPAIPKWMTWCTRAELFTHCPVQEDTKRDSKTYWNDLASPAMPGRIVNQQELDVRSSVYYNPVAVSYLTSKQGLLDGPLSANPRATLRKELRRLDASGTTSPCDRDIPTIPDLGPSIRRIGACPSKKDQLPGDLRSSPGLQSSAIVAKTAWYLIKNPANGKPADMKVWDGLDQNEKYFPVHGRTDSPRHIEISQFSRTVTISFYGLERRNCPAGASAKPFPRPHSSDPATHVVSGSQFFYYELCPSDIGLTSRPLFPCADGRDTVCIAEAGDILILAGLHVITHMQQDWTWSTFWWHEYLPSDTSQFALNRPQSLRSDSVWRNYLMDVTFDQEEPRKGGVSKQIFNPYLEAQLEDGYRSNCMSCHRLAAVHCVNRGDCDPNDYARKDQFSPFCGEVVIPGSPGYPVPVQGTSASSSLFDDAIRTSFLWTIANRPVNGEPDCGRNPPKPMAAISRQTTH